MDSITSASARLRTAGVDWPTSSEPSATPKDHIPGIAAILSLSLFLSLPYPSHSYTYTHINSVFLTCMLEPHRDRLVFRGRHRIGVLSIETPATEAIPRKGFLIVIARRHIFGLDASRESIKQVFWQEDSVFLKLRVSTSSMSCECLYPLAYSCTRQPVNLDGQSIMLHLPGPSLRCSLWERSSNLGGA